MADFIKNMLAVLFVIAIVVGFVFDCMGCFFGLGLCMCQRVWLAYAD